METSASRLLTAILLPLALFAFPARAELTFEVMSREAHSSPVPFTEQAQASTLFTLEGGGRTFAGTAKVFAHAFDDFGGEGGAIKPEESAMAQTNWTVVLRVVGEEEEGEKLS